MASTGNTLDDFDAMVRKWWAQPFDASGSALQWFLFLGLIIIIIIAWNTILRFVLE